jgi:O-6-methylguanine DNA methyltransferase
LAARRSASASASRSEHAGDGAAPIGRGPTAFVRRVVALVRSIPAGRVATYGDVAVLAGRPGAARAVGNVMRGCEDPSIPCHRVIAAGGALGGYGPDPQRKKQRLAAEGVTFAGRRVRRFNDLRWLGETTATPRRRRPV